MAVVEAEAVEKVTSPVKNGSTEKPTETPEEKKEKENPAGGDGEAVPEDPVLDQKIKRQMEYYFGDYNLPKDKFLLEEIKKDDGWVPFSVMLNFKRLTSLTCDLTVIVKALRSSELLEISEDDTKLRRSPDKPLPVLDEKRRSELMTRTLYFKGFPLDLDLNTLLTFFQQVGGFENVQMRNWHDKVSGKWNFKGSVFVTFCDREKAESVVNGDALKYNDVELVAKWQKDYIEEKKAERAEGKNNKNAKKHSAKQKEAGAKNGDEKTGEDEDESKKCEDHILGAVLHLKGLKDDVKWSDIKDKLEEFECGAVAFVDFSTGDVEGYARFKDADAAKKVFEKLEEAGKLEIAGEKAEVRVLEGEEEVKYLNDQAEQRAKRSNMKRRGSFRGRGGRGGRGHSKRARR